MVKTREQIKEIVSAKYDEIYGIHNPYRHEYVIPTPRKAHRLSDEFQKALMHIKTQNMDYFYGEPLKNGLPK